MILLNAKQPFLLLPLFFFIFYYLNSQLLLYRIHNIEVYL